MIRSIKYSLLGILILFPVLLSASDEEGFTAYPRPAVSLNGDWHYIVDPYENGFYNYRLDAFDEQKQPQPNGYYSDYKIKSPSELLEYNYDKTPVIQVPSDWNTQDPKLYYYEGTIWYRKKFDAPETKAKDRIYLYVGAANYRSDVYLNATKLGTHIGGFTPFWYDVTELVQSGENSLVIRVDNKRCKSCIPTVNTDWWNYGGITRDVKLITMPETFIRDFKIHLESSKTKKIAGSVYLENAKAGEQVEVSIPELKVNTKVTADENGIAAFELQSKKLKLWSPENPVRYAITLKTTDDILNDTVAFRSIEVQGKEVLLNDEPVFLRGISIHEEYAAEAEGRVNAAWKAEQLLLWAKDLGCNFVRLAHYPHNEDMVRLAEKIGLMVWSEVPVYWTIDWTNDETLELAKQQLEENILRDRNRANVIIWSLSNETPVIPERTIFLKKLAKHARQLDPTRLLSAAMEKHYLNDSVAVVEDPLAEVVDIVAYNQYIGWYDGLPEKCDRVSWQINYDKPVFISEFGGGAKYGHHGEPNERWTEEFQADLYTRSLNMLDQIDGLCGMSPWILTDFRSPRRPLPEIQDEFNRKGVLSEKGEKKQAFFILQKYYLNKSKIK